MGEALRRTLEERDLLVRELRSLSAAVADLLDCWDASADSLGPEWNGLAGQIEALRAAQFPLDVSGREN